VVEFSFQTIQGKYNTKKIIQFQHHFRCRNKSLLVNYAVFSIMMERQEKKNWSKPNEPKLLIVFLTNEKIDELHLF
jgi:hypothetical protein